MHEGLHDVKFRGRPGLARKDIFLLGHVRFHRCPFLFIEKRAKSLGTVLFLVVIKSAKRLPSLFCVKCLGRSSVIHKIGGQHRSHHAIAECFIGEKIALPVCLGHGGHERLKTRQHLRSNGGKISDRTFHRTRVDANEIRGDRAETVEDTGIATIDGLKELPRPCDTAISGLSTGGIKTIEHPLCQ
ncbi:MAG: zinc-finger domain-containing protein [Deltaproteobacteria bacterium]|nr:zinc-finger domain-containing protein [Deltaproteobacteria bacterium]